MPPPPRPPLLLLHGFLGRGADWDAVRVHLPSGRIADAPDLAGHGAAVGLGDDAYSMDGAASRLLARLDGPADVVGYSMGGRLALHLAVTRPEAVRRLVLVSASPGLRAEAERGERRALDAARAADLAADPAGFLDRWYRMPLFDLPDALRQRLTADRLAHVDPAEAGRSLAGMGTGAQPSHWDALRSLTVPTWAVVGERDAKFVALAHAMAEAGRVEVVVVPGAAHGLLAERPVALAAVLRQVLGEGGPEGSG